MDSNARLYIDNGAAAFTLPNAAPHYVVGRYVECTSAPISPPDAEC